MARQGTGFDSRHARLRRLILILFFLSGASALIYQIVWIRMLGLIFGITIFAVSAVLTSFMFGLAFGSLLFGKISDRYENPLRLFILLEAGIGIYALMFPFLYDGLALLYVFIHQNVHTGFYAKSIIRFLLSFMLLILPATLMGGTLPVLSKLFIRRLRELGWDIGRLYSVNNLGATLGSFAAGFYLIVNIGCTASIILAAGINLLIAAAAYRIRNSFPLLAEPIPEIRTPEAKAGNEPKAKKEEPPEYPANVIRLVLWIFAIEGFSALSYEVIWTRILAVFIDSTVYYYATIVITFIFGLSLGSILIARLIDRRINLLAFLGYIEIGIGACAIILLPVFARLPLYFATMDPNVSTWWSHDVIHYFSYFLILLAPTTLMGMTFPIVTKIYATNLRQLGSRLGNIGFLDTVGSILGAFVAGFLFIPFLGVIKAVILTAIINLAVGAILLARHPFLGVRHKIFAAALSLAILVPAILIDRKYDYFRYWESQRSGDILRYYREGASATVAVPEHEDGVKMLAINGSVTLFAEYGDLRVNKILGYLPLLLSESPKNGLVIGLGMGVSLQSLIQPYIEYVDCAEISPEVREACRVFNQENKDVLDDPKVNLYIEDGRSYLLITEQSYDIITSNAVHAKLSNSLYTSDFYEICQRRLTPGGIMCQWLPTNWLSVEEYKQLIKSFTEVFPHSSLWIVDTGHTILIGSSNPLTIDFGRLAARIGEPKIREELGLVGLYDAYEVLTQYITGDDKLREYVRNSALNADDRPRVEFSRTVDKETNLGLIRDFLNLRDDVMPLAVNLGENEGLRAARADTMKNRAAAFGHYINARFLGFAGRGFESIAELLTAKKINPENGLVNYMYPIVTRGFQEYIQEHKSTNDYNGAIAFSREALKVIPQWSLANAELGIIYNDLGKYPEALRSFEAALEAEPNSERALVGMGVTQLNLGHPDEALTFLEKARAANPGDAVTNLYIGVAYSLTNNLEKAKAVLAETISRTPGFFPPYEELGKVYAGEGNYFECIRIFENALRHIPGSIPARYSLADAYRRAGRSGDAAEIYEDILKLDAGETRARQELNNLRR